jgi:hypothetical protein
MNIKKLTELLSGCESLDELLKQAQEEARAIQKLSGTENLDVMHIGQAREIVSMRIGYLNREKEKLEEAEAEEKKAKENKKAPDAPPAA